MRIQVDIFEKASSKRKSLVILGLLLIFVFLTILSDGFESYFKGTGFYFSESFMFSSVWWLFVPLLYLQFKWLQSGSQLFTHVMIMALLVFVHLFTYPALVWLISKLFYYHTFRYWQTFEYVLSEYPVILVLVYTVPACFYLFFKSREKQQPHVSENGLAPIKCFRESFMVSDANRYKTVLAKELLYVSANTPYVNLYCAGRYFLFKTSLKSFSNMVDPECFVRIHKSIIVNMDMVDYYKSRFNGDYDIMLKNGTQLRLSRNFAANFKKYYRRNHQDTVL